MHRDKTQQLHVYNSVIESTNVVCVTKSLECCDKHKKMTEYHKMKDQLKRYSNWCVQNSVYKINAM